MQGLIAVVLVALAVGGCATMLRGSYQKVVIDTVPPNGMIVVDEREPASAPVFATLRRDRYHSVTAVSPSGGSTSRGFRSQSNGLWQVLDLLCLPIVGNIVDEASGATYDLSPDYLVIPLPTPAGASQELRAEPPVEAPQPSALDQLEQNRREQHGR